MPSLPKCPEWGARCIVGHGPRMVLIVLKRREHFAVNFCFSAQCAPLAATKTRRRPSWSALVGAFGARAQRTRYQRSPRHKSFAASWLRAALSPACFCPLKATERACRSSRRTTTLPLSTTKQTLGADCLRREHLQNSASRDLPPGSRRRDGGHGHERPSVPRHPRQARNGLA